MVFNSVALVCAVAIGVVMAAPSPGGEHKGALWGEMKCAGLEFKAEKFDNATFKAMEECHLSMKPNSTIMANTNSNSSPMNATGEKEKMMEQMCKIPICIAQKLGVMDTKGMPVKANVTAQIQTLAPAAKLTEITTAVNGCIDSHSSKLDMTKCNTYNDFFECVHKDLAKICEWKEGKN